MNLIDNIAYYPNEGAGNTLLRKYSSQEILPTERYYNSTPTFAKIEDRFHRRLFDDDRKLLKQLNDEHPLTSDQYRGSDLPASAPETSRTSIGKVRQLFEERRKQTKRIAPAALITGRTAAIGRDRSFPLEPIRRRSRYDDDYVNDNQDEIDSTRTLYDTSIFGKLPNLGGKLLSETRSLHENSNHFSVSADMSSSSTSLHRNAASSVSKITNGIARLSTKPTNGVTPRQRSQQRVPSVPPQNTVVAPKPSARNPPVTTRVAKLAPTQPVRSILPKKPLVNGTRATQAKKPAPAQAPTPPGMVSCKICGRHFTPERIKLHESICEKSAKKKRKVFDPMKQRLKGTDAEGMINQIKTTTTKMAQAPKKSNWRKEHQEFLANIRAARMVKQHLAKGGKLSDLPPPPPLDTSDYVPCPHCGRKFNEAAAERHIPKCATMRSNKPKVPVAKAAVNDPSKLTRKKINISKNR